MHIYIYIYIFIYINYNNSNTNNNNNNKYDNNNNKKNNHNNNNSNLSSEDAPDARTYLQMLRRSPEFQLNPKPLAAAVGGAIATVMLNTQSLKPKP